MGKSLFQKFKHKPARLGCPYHVWAQGYGNIDAMWLSEAYVLKPCSVHEKINGRAYLEGVAARGSLSAGDENTWAKRSGRNVYYRRVGG